MSFRPRPGRASVRTPLSLASGLLFAAVVGALLVPTVAAHSSGAPSTPSAWLTAPSSLARGSEMTSRAATLLADAGFAVQGTSVARLPAAGAVHPSVAGFEPKT